MFTFTVVWKEEGTLHRTDIQSCVLPGPDDVLECKAVPLLRVLWRHLRDSETLPVLYCCIVSPETAEAISDFKRND